MTDINELVRRLDKLAVAVDQLALVAGKLTSVLESHRAKINMLISVTSDIAYAHDQRAGRTTAPIEQLG